MKKFTNHQPGPRGINIEGGSTVWIEPGETVEIDPKTIAGPVPDLGKAATQAADDAALTEAVQTENADLKARIAALEAENAKLTKKPN